MDRVISEHVVSVKRSKKDLRAALMIYKPKLRAILAAKLRRHNQGIKYQLAVLVKLSKFRFETGQTVEINPWFLTEMKPVLTRLTLDVSLDNSFVKLVTSLEEFVGLGSGWNIEGVQEIKVTVARYRVLGGRGGGGVELPKLIRDKHVCVNVSCDDDHCFMWSVLAGMFPVEKNASRKTIYYDHVSKLNLEGLYFPMKLTQIPSFEKQNDCSINVFGLHKNCTPYPLFITDNRSCDKHCDLLLYKDHYVLIKDLSRFFASIFRIKRSKVWYCNYCLLKFESEKSFKQHRVQCKSPGVSMSDATQFCVMPPPGSKTSFTNFSNQNLSSWMIFADFETLNVKMKDRGKTEKTAKKTMLVPNAFSAVRVCLEEQYSSKPYAYMGKNPVEKFLKFLFAQRAEILSIQAGDRQKMRCTEEDMESFLNAKKCCICDRKFTKVNFKVRHHYHLGKSGPSNYIGAAHNVCNLKYAPLENNPKIVVILHNAMNFDNKLILKSIFNHLQKSEIKVIPKTNEHFISFMFEYFVFIDSYLFLPSSLEKLVEDLLLSGREKFVRVNKWVQNNKQRELVYRKAVLPYAYLDNWDKLEETKLPSKRHFYNDLTQKAISAIEYRYAKKFWRAFNCKTLGDFLKSYMILDTLLLADVFVEFRAHSYALFGLDVAKYFTISMYSWDAMLKLTKVEIEQINQRDQYEFFEKNLRGGLCGPSCRYREANNPYIPTYDKNKACSYICSVDAVSLYSKAMLSPLPYGGYQWLSRSQLKTFDVTKVPPGGKYGYVVECTLEYDASLHDLHNDLPMAPEKMLIKHEDLSPYSQKLAQKLDIKTDCKVEKLVTTFKTKHSYVVHFRTLQLYLSEGMKLIKIHRVLKFKQKAFLRPYIDYCVQRRLNSQSVFQANLSKLMQNSVFGYSISSPRKRVNYYLVNKPSKCLNLVGKPQFKRATCFDEKLFGIQMQKSRVVLNKFPQLGFTVLEESKRVMYKWHYVILRKVLFPESEGFTVTNAYIDTDGQILYIENKAKEFDIYEHLAPYLKKYFDTSNFKPESKYYNLEHKYSPGYFKIEMAEKIIDKYCALRAKTYSVLPLMREKQIHKCKGIKTYKLVFEDYTRTLFGESKMVHSFSSIRSYKQVLYTVEQQRVGLNSFDDKRFYLDPITSLAFGHRRTRKRKSY